MLTKLEVRTNQGAVLSLPLQDSSSGYVVADIDGLLPVKATIVSSSFATMDGGQYQSSRREPRNIVIKLALEPDYSVGSVRDLRSNLYAFFMPKSEASLRFYDSSGLMVNIAGRVESFEAPLFTKEPEATITVLCFNPDFVNESMISIDGNTSPDNIDMLINYAGTVETGINLVLNAPLPQAVPNFTIYNRSAGGNIETLYFAAPLAVGEGVKLCTLPGSKEVRHIHVDHTEDSIIWGVSPQSNWIKLYPGENYFLIKTDGAPLPYNITYYDKFGGL